MQNILTLETKKYEIKINNFEGPLDLLCHLIEKNKMDIFEVNISDITEQYIEYIKQMEEMNLEVTSEFIIMASTLLYLKSKTLLPKDTIDEEELTEEQLIQRIIEYKKYKEISKVLKEMYNKNCKRMFKAPDEIKLPKQKLEKEYKKEIISETYSDVVNKNKVRINKNARNIQKIAITDTYTVGSKVKDMYRELIRHKKFVFNRMFSIKKHNKNEVVTAFSGLLEMSRRSKVLTEQDELFGDITVTKKPVFGDTFQKQDKKKLTKDK